jgi:hypothetical protein
MGMKKYLSFSAIAALSAATPIVGALAATIEITGDPYKVHYGSAEAKNNVVSNQFAPNPAGIYDFTGRRNTPWLAGGTVLSEVSSYYVDWYFNGAESGDTINFLSSTVSFAESNQNNNNQGGNDPGWTLLGTTTNIGLNSPIPFSLTDTTYAMTLANGTLDPAAGSLIYAYADPKYWKGELIGWTLSLDATDWFVFAFNDPGSGDKDFDDYVGIGHVRVADLPPSPTPLPGALPLMGSVLGGGYLMRKWRSRRQRKSAALAA